MARQAANTDEEKQAAIRANSYFTITKGSTPTANPPAMKQGKDATPKAAILEIMGEKADERAFRAKGITDSACDAPLAKR